MLMFFFQFEDGGTLVYEDVRKFGTMELLAPALLDAYFISKKLGPEPSEQDFDLQVFQAALAKSKKPIKSHLPRPDLGSWTWQYLCG